MKSGVYEIKNIINNHRYIGSSINITIRLSKHKNELLKQKHCNGYLQNAVNKYGIENFEFKSLVICPPNERLDLEQYLLDYYQAEYNIRKIVDSNLTLKFSDEHKQKISNAHKGKIISTETRQKLREINLGKTYSDEVKLKHSIAHKGKIPSEEWKRVTRLTRIKSIDQIDKITNNVIKTFECIIDAERDLGINHVNIIKCAKGQRKSAGGFIWKYTNPM